MVKSSQLCYLLIYVEDVATVPWKPEVKVKHATEDNFESSSEVHVEHSLDTQIPC